MERLGVRDPQMLHDTVPLLSESRHRTMKQPLSRRQATKSLESHLNDKFIINPPMLAASKSCCLGITNTQKQACGIIANIFLEK